MEGSVYRFADFSVSPAERRLYRGTQSIALSPQAFDAMYLLVRSEGGLVAKTVFMQTLWPETHVSESNLTNIIVHLRKVLGREAIQTVSKFGYRFTLPVTGEPRTRQKTYASFVRGRELMAERSVDSIQGARDLFTMCVAEDTQFATGWAWLGRTCRAMEKFRSGQPNAVNVADAVFQRAFAIDPDLACAHNFYTQLQVDMGQGLQAMVRLATRIRRQGEDAETLTGLVQVLRCCGLLEASVTAHERAAALDPTVKTSVAHTMFLLGDYASVFETYVGKGYYLDAASWAAMGQIERAANMLRKRLTQPELGTFMSTLMASLLAVVEGRNESAASLAQSAKAIQEPEGAFYFARHCGMVGDAVSSVELIRNARLGGFWSSKALQRDNAFDGVRRHAEFAEEIRLAQGLEASAWEAFGEALGEQLATGWGRSRRMEA